MKNIYIIFICLCTLSSCSHKWNVNCQNTLIPKENIKVFLDSFVKENKHVNYIYELYIDKIDPHNYSLLLYAGEESLTKKENKDYNQSSVASVVSLGVKINIYSGIEHYFEDSSKQNSFSNQNEHGENSVLWAIKDSFGILSCHKLEEGYPFIPLPKKIEPNAFAPPIINP